MRSGSVVGVAVFFAAMGLAALIDPARILETFDVAVTSPEGRNEVRAVYGGFGIAMAVALALALRVQALRPGILVCLSLALAGMALGRLCSFAIDQHVGAAPALFVGVELLLAVLLLRGAPTLRSDRQSGGAA